MAEFNPLGELNEILFHILNETVNSVTTQSNSDSEEYLSADESEHSEPDSSKPTVNISYDTTFSEVYASLYDGEANNSQPIQLKMIEEIKNRQQNQVKSDSILIKEESKGFNVDEEENIMEIKRDYDKKYDRNMKNLESSRQQGIIVKRYLDCNDDILKFTHTLKEFTKLVSTIPNQLQQTVTFKNSHHCRNCVEAQLKRFENKSYNQISELENAFRQLCNEMDRLKTIQTHLESEFSQYQIEITNQMQQQQQQHLLQQQQLLQHKTQLSQNLQMQIPLLPKPASLSISENFFNLSSLKTTATPQPQTSPTELIKYLEAMESKCLTWEKTWSKTRTMNFKRLANTTVNAISSQDMDSLMDKINKLDVLLSGETLTALDQTVKLETPEEVEYCSNLITTKLIKKGEQEVSSNPKAAHPIASVVMSLCSKHQTLAKLLLGSFYRACPIMAPIFPNQSLAPNSKEFLLSIGYKVKENQLEESDQFSNRIKGLLRLYTCVMQFPTEGICRVFSIPSHFHGINKAWTWMVQILQGPMVPGVSEVALHAAIEFMGYRMSKVYGNQFSKLVHLTRNQFLPNLKRISPPEHNPSIARLQKFLDDNKTFIPESDGAFSDGFWKKNVFKI